jgi:hypothetical protein
VLYYHDASVGGRLNFAFKHQVGGKFSTRRERDLTSCFSWLEQKQPRPSAIQIYEHRPLPFVAVRDVISIAGVT